MTYLPSADKETTTDIMFHKELLEKDNSDRCNFNYEINDTDPEGEGKVSFEVLSVYRDEQKANITEKIVQSTERGPRRGLFGICN